LAGKSLHVTVHRESYTLEYARYHPGGMSEPAASSSPGVWSATELKANPHDSPEKSQRVRAMFAAIARRYDLNNRVHSLWRDQAWRRFAVRFSGLQAGERVLDVACGTGDLAEAFADGGAGSVTGLDFTAEMLELAEHKAARKRRRPGTCRPAYVQGDAMALPFPDASFNVVSIAFGIRNVSDPKAALRECSRVLHSGGRLVMLEFSEPRNPVMQAFNKLYCRGMMPITATLIARDRSGAYRYLARSVATFLEPAELVRCMELAGFVDVERKPLTFGVCTCYRGVRT
jgi:demethylmenaquinone methyltransferase/2-methoxy-6-polyprenyl-1,4-benzoquinol methylase